jgi:hypothetical protein
MIVPAAMGELTQLPPAKYGPGDDPDVNDTVLDPKGGLIFIKGGSKQTVPGRYTLPLPVLHFLYCF